MLKTAFQIFALVLSLSLTLAACGGSDESEGGESGDPILKKVDRSTQVHIVTADRVSKLDPHATDNGGDVKVIRQVFDTLVRLNENDPSKLEPMLAESFQIDSSNPEQHSLIFKLREGVTFHDGEAFDAAAAKLSLDRLMFETLPAESRPYVDSFQRVESIEADGMILRVTLDGPIGPLMLNNFTMFNTSMISPKVLNALKDKSGQIATAYVANHPIGTGAFKVDSFDSSTGLTRLSANENYWGGAPKISTVIFEQMSDPVTGFERFQKGDVQLCDAIPRQSWSDVSESKNHTLIADYPLNVCYLGLNAKHPKMQNAKLREAIQLLIDRDPIIQMYYGTARESWSILSPRFPSALKSSPLQHWSDDVSVRRARAKELIAGSGIGDTPLKIYYPKLERPYLPSPPSIADKLGQQLREAGLNVTVQGVDNTELFSTTHIDDKYEMVLIGWMSDNGHPDNFYMPLTAGKGDTQEPSDNNISRVFDPAVFKVLKAAQQELDPQTRADFYATAESLLQNNVRGYVPLLNAKQAIGVVKRLKGIEVDPSGAYRLYRCEFVDE